MRRCARVLVAFFLLAVGMMPSARAQDQYAWAELLAFDNTCADYGVGDYLARMPFRLKGVSLLLCDPDILHAHAGLERDFPIGDRHCSYFARPKNEERDRQRWTAWQLRGLVGELSRRGVEAYPSFFESSLERESWAVAEFGETPKRALWVDAHPELFAQTRTGKMTRSLCVFKDLADGSSYADFFARQALRFLKDYGFAGLHLADGYGHSRFALVDADFSEQTLVRFAAENPDLRLPKEGRPDWIVRNARAAWCRFYAGHHADFVERVVRQLKPAGFSVRLNTCWTRDPLEALYRYGVDYRRLAACGIDGFFCESSATVLALEGWARKPAEVVDCRRAALLRLSSAVPTELIRLACIKDGLEQYNALRHAPMRLAGELMGLETVWRNGTPAASSVLWCLADGVCSEEWNRLNRWSSFLPQPCTPQGVAVVVSAAADEAEFEAICTNRLPTSYRLLSELLNGGAVLEESLDVAQALASNRPLLVLNPACFPDAERQALRRRSGALVEFGLGDGRTVFGPTPAMDESGSWIDPLPAPAIPDEALAACVKKINALAPACPDANMSDLRVTAGRDARGRLIVLARNVRPTYLEARVRVAEAVDRAVALTDEPTLPVKVENRGNSESFLSAKIPPGGGICLRCERVKKEK